MEYIYYKHIVTGRSSTTKQNIQCRSPVPMKHERTAAAKARINSAVAQRAQAAEAPDHAIALLAPAQACLAVWRRRSPRDARRVLSLRPLTPPRSGRPPPLAGAGSACARGMRRPRTRARQWQRGHSSRPLPVRSPRRAAHAAHAAEND